MQTTVEEQFECLTILKRLSDSKTEASAVGSSAHSD